MKLSLTLLPVTLGLASATREAPTGSIRANSNIGQNILARARRIQNNNDDNAEPDYTWVANMSLKFQGCYHTQQWNDEANGENDLRISTAKLVRFRLCPTSSCAMNSPAGCESGYGDYIIDMETYVNAYLEAVQQDQEYNCKYEEQYGDCACDKDGQGDDFNEDICRYECYMGKGMEYCIDKNPYEEEGEKKEQWNIREYAECRQYKFENNNNNNRALEEEAKYYVGAYCAENGGHIFLGLFTDDTCSQPADSSAGAKTFATLSNGKSLPYSDTTLIGTECMSCKETQQANEQNAAEGGNDANDADNIKESCENLYQAAGKCESDLGISSPNNNGCTFMEGITIWRKNGAVIRSASTKNVTASVFIGLFACSFVLLGGYSYYLKMKLDRSKIDLPGDE
ncbi:hypothetical protein ACHAWX_001329 [Stephanocyclus meneghinianus]